VRTVARRARLARAVRAPSLCRSAAARAPRVPGGPAGPPRARLRCSQRVAPSVGLALAARVVPAFAAPRACRCLPHPPRRLRLLGALSFAAVGLAPRRE
jgi:hypothetical protein